MLARGVPLGLLAGAGAAVARGLTWRPYAPVLLPFDLALGVLLFAVAGLAASASPVARRPRVALALWLVPLLALLGLCWAQGTGLATASARRTVATGVLFAGVAGLAVRGFLGPRSSRWSLESFALASVLALVAAVAGRPRSGGFALILPAAWVLLFAGGLPRLEPSRPRARLLVLAAALALAAFAARERPGLSKGVEVAAPSKPPPADRSAVIVVLDTVRRDHLSLYGYPRPTTPRLDRWAEGAAVFTRATSNSSWTLPSHASLFTGLVPRRHGAHGFRGSRGWGNAHPLAPGIPTLAEIAQRSGLVTGAVVANHFYLDRHFGLDRGFSIYWVGKPHFPLRLGLPEALAHRLRPYAYEAVHWPYFRAHFVTENALRWLEAVGDRPFLLFVNYMDAHDPSRRPPTPEVPRGPDETLLDLPIERQVEILSRGRPDPATRRRLVDAYDRELQFLDRELGRLLEVLARPPYAERTLVVVASDHGEHLGEHGLVFHSKDLHREVVEVPLLVRGPGVAPGPRSKPVQLQDVFVTVLDWLGLALPAETQGRDLFSPRTHPIVSEWYAADNALFLDPRFGGRFDRDLWTLREGRWRLFLDSRGRVRLYDLETDPGETRDLARDHPERTERMRARLEAWLANHPPRAKTEAATPLEVDRERLEQLRALGYAQ